MIGTWIAAGLLLLVGLWLFRKGRRFFSTQPLSPGRHGLRLAFLSMLASLLMVLPLSTIFLKAIAVAAGGLTAVFSLRTTRYSRRGDRWVFTPNLKIGAVLFALVVARVVWRLIRVSDMAGREIDPRNPWSWIPDGPRGWTLVLVLVLCGYFLVYESGLLVAALHRRDTA